MRRDDTGPSEDETVGEQDFGYAWVTSGTVEDFVQRMQALREGDAPGTAEPEADDDHEEAQPAVAIRALQAFAIKRDVAELIQFSAHFDYRDAVHVLATAALTRSVPQAAELAIGQWKAEGAGRSGSTPLSDGIIHDVACQRATLDVAEFVATCRRLDTPELAAQTLRVFARTSSGRTHLDKALLYIALRDEGCVREADTLLRLTLDAIDVDDSSPEVSDADPEELHDLVGALHQFSPSERILEEWLQGEVVQAPRVDRTVRVTAKLISIRSGDTDILVKDVGLHWPAQELVDLCGLLLKPQAEKCAALRGYAASRADQRALADIIAAWQRSEALTKTTRNLLAEIVRGGAGASGPRSLDDIDRIHTWLSRNKHASPQCTRLLRIEAAVQIAGRSGPELVTLLREVTGRRDRQHVAREIAQQLATRILETDPASELLTGYVKVFISYVKQLRAKDMSMDRRWARKELADPVGPARRGEGAAGLVAEIASRLYAEDCPADGWDLLERYLENEDRVTPQGVVDVTRRLRGSTMTDERRHFLLRATVGRWSDASRDEAVSALWNGGCDTEATAVITSQR